MTNSKESNFILFKGLSEKQIEDRKDKGIKVKSPLLNLDMPIKYNRTESLHFLDNLFSESPIRRSEIQLKSNIKQKNSQEEESTINNNDYSLELSAILKQNYPKYFRQVILIQSAWRGAKAREALAHIKMKVFVIQRSYRNHLHIKYDLPANYYQIDKFLFKENEQLILNYQENLSDLFPALFKDDVTSSNMFTYAKGNESEKIHFFSKVLDFDLMIDTEECYDKTWGELYNSVYVYCCIMDTPIQVIELGGQHTLCLDSKGKLYSYGWNNYGQCGEEVDSSLIFHSEYKKRISLMMSTKNSFNLAPLNSILYVNSIKTEGMMPIENISCGEDHSLMVDAKGTVWGFGLNLSGQLGGKSKRKRVQKPTIITELQQEVIKEVKCQGNLSFALSEKGDAFMWPWSNKSSELQHSPIKLQLKSLTEKVRMIACGNNFVLLLSITGKVYSMGKDNKYGQLGHGDNKSRYHPALIDYFPKNNEIICQVSCGFKHCIAKTFNGRAFTWGLGTKGQLGTGSFENKALPCEVDFDKALQIKVYQVTAGFRSTYLLTSKLKIYMCGCNGTSPAKEVPVLFDPGEKIPEMKSRKKYSIVRIMSTWNKSFSVFYGTIIARSKLGGTDDQIDLVMKKIASNWTDHNVNAPYIQGISDHFSKNQMIMNKQKKGKT